MFHLFPYDGNFIDYLPYTLVPLLGISTKRRRLIVYLLNKTCMRYNICNLMKQCLDYEPIHHNLELYDLHFRYWPLSWPRKSDPQTSGTLCTLTQKHLFLKVRTQRSPRCVSSENGYDLSPEYWGESLQQHQASENKRTMFRLACAVWRKL